MAVVESVPRWPGKASAVLAGVKGSGFAPRVPRALDPAATRRWGNQANGARRAPGTSQEHTMETITLQVELPDELAWALAQFLKRLTFSDCLQLAVSQEEAYQMIHATEALRAALARVGYAPR